MHFTSKLPVLTVFAEELSRNIDCVPYSLGWERGRRLIAPWQTDLLHPSRTIRCLIIRLSTTLQRRHDHLYE